MHSRPSASKNGFAAQVSSKKKTPILTDRGSCLTLGLFCSWIKQLSVTQAFDVAEKQLTGGTINLITVLQAEQTLFTAQNNLVLVRLSKLQAASSLFQALGGGWTPAGTLASVE